MWLTMLLLLQTMMTSRTLKVTRLLVDEYAKEGEGAEMGCEFDLEGDRLYSVKWYKDNQEFFRYVPRDHPKKQQSFVKGIILRMGRSDKNRVYIDNMSRDTSGTFTCEVSSEAPRFKTSALDQEVKVVNPPKSEPRLVGGRKEGYRVGDMLDINCTSPPSNPPALLRFFINDEMVDGSQVITYPIKEAANQLKVPTIGLGFQVKRQHFQQHELRIKCTSTIYNVYFESTQSAFNGIGSQEQHYERVLLFFSLCLIELISC